MTGFLQLDAALLFGGMCFLGSALINPLFAKLFQRIKLTSTLVKMALCFQCGLLVVFLLIWIPTIDDRQFTDVIKTTAVC